MNRLLIISNRLPIKLKRENGELNFENSAGGLATGLGSFYKNYDSMWIGWPGIPLENIQDTEEIKHKLEKEKCYPVFMRGEDVDLFYYGFCNKTLWPLLHYFPQYAVYRDDYWERYIKANEMFRDTLLKVAKPGDLLWVQDYHLFLLPKMLRDEMPDLSIGYFLHIPFPAYEMFRLIPYRKELLEGLMGADLVGFHTYNYMGGFLESTQQILGHEHVMGKIYAEHRVVKADVFPMGIDYEKFSSMPGKPEVKEEKRKIKEEIGEEVKIVLSVDRLDYSKGILHRLDALERFFKEKPEYHGKLCCIFVVVPSREKVEQYEHLKRQVDECIGRINSSYGTISWQPIRYMYRSFPFHELTAMYDSADIGLVTPLRDGMNLVAKEMVATKSDNKLSLILSELAGASKELVEAIIINPNNQKEIVKALETAMNMTDEEKTQRTIAMKERIKRYDVAAWAKDFINNLKQIKEEQKEIQSKRITDEIKQEIKERYSKSKNRLIMLDYDGTLVSFETRFGEPEIDDELSNMLKKLTKAPNNAVVILSGRDKETLNKAFSKLEVGLISEHGVWIKKANEEWDMLDTVNNDWKKEVRPILEHYVDRTPGSFIQEKEYTFTWHYHKSRKELGNIRSRELRKSILDLTENLGIEVMEGHRTIEIKNFGVDKGRAIHQWLGKGQWDFVMAIGDDWSDEDAFEVIPDDAYAIKVGSKQSRAKYYVNNVQEVRSLINELIKE
jgi:trehalose 6-phosphate synthase/phosphatase